MPIPKLGSAPDLLVNGQVADATQVMADLNFIIDGVNNLTADDIGFDQATVYGAGSIGEGMNQLFSFAKYAANGPSITITAPDAQTLSWDTVQPITTTASPTFAGLTVAHWSGSTPPTLASTGTGAGTGPTASVAAGSSILFRFNLTTGSAPASASAAIANFSFAAIYAAAPIVTIIPIGARTSAIQATAASSCVVGSASTTGFQFNAGTSSALAAATAYSWAFLVHGL